MDCQFYRWRIALRFGHLIGARRWNTSGPIWNFSIFLSFKVIGDGNVIEETDARMEGSVIRP